MTTKDTHPEHNDWQKPGGEQQSASESSQDAPHTDEQSTTLDAQSGATMPEAQMDSAPFTPDTTHRARQKAPHTDDQEHQPEQAHPQRPLDLSISDADETFVGVSELFAAAQTAPLESETLPLFILEEAPASETEAVRPFSDFIEEFRQTEVRLNALLPDQETDLTPLPMETAMLPTTDAGTAAGETVAPDTGSIPSPALNEQATTARPAISVERPVSPLLRPATRLRMPRHGRHRAEEHPKHVEPSVTQPQPAVEEKVESAPTAEAPQLEEQESARPARRYRFDRPAATASATPSLAKPTAQTRSAELKEKRATAAQQKEAAKNQAAATPEAPAPKVSEPEIEAAEVPTPTPAPTPSVSERRKRGSHERQREKEQPTPVTPIAEVAAPEKEQEFAPEVPIEDLPPLEYAELQAANSRRRRRRRIGNGNGINGVVAPKAALPEAAAPAAPISPPAAPGVLPKGAPANSPAAQNYNIVSGYTVSQMNQGNDNAGPFMGPEPSPARGSVFNTSPQIRHTRTETTLRSATTHPIKHGESPLMSTAAVNHLGTVVAQAIQIQTDRMVSELRRANQVPTNISVSLPPFPSNERVGVFVDVANLLYSARTLRMTVDFGKLLDFLRGNRRLVRAQAYCPTSPQPGDDQMFLQAVKGLGYRITTKNYKTFSSGAKKADLDLDLCMDVVRLVDGKAVDCVVLVSGDSDFMPMLDYCSDHGVRVEVAAFDESMSATLRQACDLFVNLSMLEEIRA